MLQLDSKYRVLVDSSQQNLILEKYEDVTDRKTNETKQVWQGKGFFGLSLRSVLLSYAKHKMADGVSDVDNADLLISKINELERNINKISKEITFKIESKKDE